jgi:hypothetical protein
VMYCYSTFLFHYYYYYYYYYYSTHFCLLYFSEMPWSNFMKPCRKNNKSPKLCLGDLITYMRSEMTIDQKPTLNT